MAATKTSKAATAEGAANANGAAKADGAVRVPPRLKQRYRDEIHGAMLTEFGYPNVMQVPTVTKVVVNMGVGEAARDAKLIDGAVRDLTIITGQKPALARPRKPIPPFQLPDALPSGAH